MTTTRVEESASKTQSERKNTHGADNLKWWPIWASQRSKNLRPHEATHFFLPRLASALRQWWSHLSRESGTTKPWRALLLKSNTKGDEWTARRVVQCKDLLELVSMWKTEGEESMVALAKAVSWEPSCQRTSKRCSSGATREHGSTAVSDAA